jgi:predicted transcriptional regulator
MLLGTKKTLYDHITEALLGNPMNVSQITLYLERAGVSATVQGIYKTLRELVAEDIVVKQKKNYSVK